MFELMIPGRSRRSAFPALRGLRSVDELFEDLWRGFGAGLAGGETLPAFSPRIDVRETDEAIVLSAELPGLEEKDFEVCIDDDVLTLKGEKRSEHQEAREGHRYVETRSGAFQRRLRLPAEVDPDAVKASFRNGVLTVTVPKPEEAIPGVRRVPVSSE